MSFVRLTRPDGSPIAINPDEVVHAAPVPASGPLMGPLTTGTRIVFRNQSHQDARELLDEVIARIDAARSARAAAVAAPAAVPARAPAPVTRRAPRDSRS
jgi:hypothetical protein